MNFVKHSNLEGKHAFLSASKYHWLNYTEDKLVRSYNNALAVQRGTELHEYAYNAIRLYRKQPPTKDTLNMYINDAIGYKMTPEVVLYYSDNCFGTADTISFRDNFLRIHDLKTGETSTHIEQLLIYAAIFCLEYKYDPNDIDIELRIYQLSDIKVYIPTSNEIKEVMKKIIEFDKLIEKIKKINNE